jgi:hypothetical protein
VAAGAIVTATFPGAIAAGDSDFTSRSPSALRRRRR